MNGEVVVIMGDRKWEKELGDSWGGIGEGQAGMAWRSRWWNVVETDSRSKYNGSIMVEKQNDQIEALCVGSANDGVLHGQ